MTIQEAIKSGKPFRRRKLFKEWFFVDSEDHNRIKCQKSEYVFVVLAPRSDDILATDWEVKE